MAAFPSSHRASRPQARRHARCSPQAHSGNCRRLRELQGVGQAAAGLCGQRGVGRRPQSAG
eukprot:1846741-Alexandrium_andersonii.AAC.1